MATDQELGNLVIRLVEANEKLCELNLKYAQQAAQFHDRSMAMMQTEIDALRGAVTQATDLKGLQGLVHGEGRSLRDAEREQGERTSLSSAVGSLMGLEGGR